MEIDTHAEREAVQDLLDAIEDSGWSVEEYDASGLDPLEPTRLSVTLEQNGLDDEVVVRERATQPPRAIILRYIREQEGDSGVAVNDVIEYAVNETGSTEGDVRDVLQQLKVKGEVYEPADDRLRAT